MTGVAALVAVAAVLVEPSADPLAHPRELGLFALAGVLAPGLSQAFFTRAVRDAGPSRSAAALGVAALGMAVYVLIARRGRLRASLAVLHGRPLVLAGLLFGLSYVFLFEAYYRARVSVVSPLVATESLWGVLLSALFPSTEVVGLRLVLAAVLVVSGGILIGVSR